MKIELNSMKNTKPYILNPPTHPNGASGKSINIYAKSSRWSDCLIEVEITRQSYDGLKLLGASNPSSLRKLSTWPQLLRRETKCYLTVG